MRQGFNKRIRYLMGSTTFMYVQSTTGVLDFLNTNFQFSGSFRLRSDESLCVRTGGREYGLEKVGKQINRFLRIR